MSYADAIAKTVMTSCQRGREAFLEEEGPGDKSYPSPHVWRAASRGKGEGSLLREDGSPGNQKQDLKGPQVGYREHRGQIQNRSTADWVALR